MRITDVYGDFIYVGRSSHPVFGKPTDVWIHDNYFRRNGRQGVAVTHGFNVVIERNDIGDTRRATFDLEPASETGSVRNVWIRNNKVGPGRLMFVAGHGAGDVSDVYIQNNVLTGKNMGVDFVAPAGRRERQNIVVTGNVSDTAVGNGRGAVLRFVGYDYIDVRNNRQPMQAGRNMHMVGIMGSCKVTVANNDLPNGVGQLIDLDDPPDCSAIPPLTLPIRPTMFEGENLKIDVGGAGGAGIIPCPTTSNCGGFYTGARRDPDHGRRRWHAAGAHDAAWQPAVRHPDPQRHLQRHALVDRADGRHQRPTLPHRHRRPRSASKPSFDVNRVAGGKNKVVRRTYSVPSATA